MQHLDRDLNTLIELYNSAWKDNWGFVPINDDEAKLAAENLKMVIEPRLFLFAEIDGEPVAVAGSLPDMNWALRLTPSPWALRDWYRVPRMLWLKRRIPGGRMMFYGVKEPYRQKGLESILFSESLAVGNTLGYSYGELGWVLEDNEMLIRLCQRMQAEPYKTYRIYSKNLGG